jgi:succinoglycan biosynthesis transport protein ExoP
MEPVKQPMPTNPESSLHFLDYWRIIRIRKTVIISVFLLISLTATVVTFILPKYYSSTTRIEVNPLSGVIPTSETPATALTTIDPTFLQTEFLKMKSGEVLGLVIKNLDLNDVLGKKMNPNGTPLRTEDTMQYLKDRMNLSVERNSKIIDISFASEDPEEAARIANGIATAYRDYRLDEWKSNAMAGVSALEEEYAQDAAAIQAVQTNMENLRAQLHITDTDPNSLTPTPTLSTADVQRYNEEKLEYQKNYTDLQTTLTFLQSIEQTNREALRDILPRMMPNGDQALSGLLDKWHTARQAYVAATNNYGPSNPEVTGDEAMMKELDSEINDSVSGVMSSLQANVIRAHDDLDKLTATYNAAISNQQEESIRGQPYWEAKRKWADMMELHKLLAAKIEQVKSDAVVPKTTMVSVVDYAVPSKSPDSPKKTLYIGFGVIVGLLVGIGLAFFIEYLDTSVKTIDDVERALQAPVLGVIPQNVGYLIDEGAESQHAEAYRVLRTNLLFSRKDDKLNTIVVVSAGAGEGKSTTTLNLATVFAQSGQRVLVVDSDLRRPTMHKLLRVTNNLM